MTEKRKWFAYFMRQLTAAAAMFLIRFYFAGLLVLGGMLAVAGLTLGAIRLTTGEPLASEKAIVVCLLWIGLGIVLLICVYGAFAAFQTHRIIAGRVVWVEEGIDIDGPQEWVSRVRLSCCPEIEIVTPVAFPYNGTMGRVMIAWIPRGPSVKGAHVVALDADLI